MNKELLHLLACPRCRGSLELVEESGTPKGLSCAACAVMYPIRDDIPVMLLEEALPLSSQTAQPGTAPKNASGSCACS